MASTRCRRAPPDVRDEEENNFSQSNGDWLFNGQFSGDPMADFLLGRPASLSQASGQTRPYCSTRCFRPMFRIAGRCRAG